MEESYLGLGLEGTGVISVESIADARHGGIRKGGAKGGIHKGGAKGGIHKGESLMPQFQPELLVGGHRGDFRREHCRVNCPPWTNPNGIF
jgi:hypothetical protein